MAELESAYHRLALAAPMSVRRLNGMLNREHTIWDQRLRRAEEDLQTQKMLAGRPGQPVVLDTSVLMEGEPFLRFGWHTLTPPWPAERFGLLTPRCELTAHTMSRRPRQLVNGVCGRACKRLYARVAVLPAVPS
jgi:hypothetical protein